MCHLKKEEKNKHNVIFVFFSYVADENGYRAGFRLGRAALESPGPNVRSPELSGPLGPPGPPGLGGTTYLPPKTTGADRSYLPPH